jgi:NH3-dependent NAD+ synthetase
LIPQSSIDKVPSAELRPNQTDQDSLPPYPLLDAILNRYIEEEKSAADHWRGFRSGDRVAGDPNGGPERIQAAANGARLESHQPRLRLRSADANRSELPAKGLK